MCGVGVVVVVVGGGSVGDFVCSVVVGVGGPTPLNQLQHSCVVDDTKEGLLRLFELLEKFETFENVEQPLLSLNLAICG